MNPRQRQIACGLFAGLSVKEIAGRLNLSGKTLAFHWKKMKKQYGLQSYVDLVHRMYQGTLMVLILSATCACGADLKLAWTASPTTGVTNYLLYAHTNTLSAANLTNAVMRLTCTTNLTASVEGLGTGNWWFTVTAWKGGIESLPSNVVQAEVPAPPTNMRTLILQYSGTLTNWSDVNFIRLKIP